MGTINSKFVSWVSKKKNTFCNFIIEKRRNYENKRAREIYKKVFTEEQEDNVYDNTPYI
jgi:hypothetical protein